MTEQEELQEILLKVIYVSFPEKAEEIIQALITIKKGMTETMMKYNFNMDEEKVIDSILGAFKFGILNRKVN